jgi:hypothetical protein
VACFEKRGQHALAGSSGMAGQSAGPELLRIGRESWGISFQEWLHHRCLERSRRLQMTQPQNAKLARLLSGLFP